MDEIESELRDKFGLNSYESRAYLVLVSSPMKTKDLATAATIPMPRIYDTLRTLEMKGFVHQSGENYVAESPSVALKTYLLGHQRSYEKAREAKEASMKHIVELLQPVMASKDELSQEPVLLRGIDAIAGRFFEILSTSKDITLMVRKAPKVKGVFRPSRSRASGSDSSSLRGRQSTSATPDSSRASRSRRDTTTTRSST